MPHYFKYHTKWKEECRHWPTCPSLSDAFSNKGRETCPRNSNAFEGDNLLHQDMHVAKNVIRGKRHEEYDKNPNYLESMRSDVVK